VCKGNNLVLAVKSSCGVEPGFGGSHTTGELGTWIVGGRGRLGAFFGSERFDEKAILAGIDMTKARGAWKKHFLEMGMEIWDSLE